MSSSSHDFFSILLPNLAKHQFINQQSIRIFHNFYEIVMPALYGRNETTNNKTNWLSISWLTQFNIDLIGNVYIKTDSSNSICHSRWLFQSNKALSSSKILFYQYAIQYSNDSFQPSKYSKNLFLLIIIVFYDKFYC